METFDVDVPERFWPNFTSVGGAAEHIHMLQMWVAPVPSPRQILVVGVFGGRDLWAMRAAGDQVTGFDLANVDDCAPMVRGDAESGWPFADDAFDVIVLGEILEHLILDHHALLEARRVLRSSGTLLVSVPFLHDKAAHHVRVHTPASICRLLSTACFTIRDYIERPGLFALGGFNLLNHLLAISVFGLTGRSAYGFLGRFYGSIEARLGRILWIPRRFLRALGLINWGAMICAEPGTEVMDYKQVNRTDFSDPEQPA